MMDLAEEKKTSWLDRSLFSVVQWNWETSAWMLLLAAAILLRFWDLGSRALHHDESIHAVHSWYILSAKGIYRHDPTYHGPFLYYSEALMYFLFGATDAAARFMPALFGSILTATPLFFRRYIGRIGALAAGVMIAVSPSILYYSRALRHDMFSLAATVVVIAAFFKFMEDRRHRWVYLGAIAYTVGFSNHDLMLLISTPMIVLALGAGMVWERIAARRGGADGPLTDALRCIPASVWTNCVLIFVMIYVPLFTSLFTNMAGLYTGSIGQATYWLSQHEVKRGDQPFYYYALLLPLEESLPLLLAFGALALLAWRGTRGKLLAEPMSDAPVAHPALDRYFILFAMYWAALSFFAYSFAGERMPWLTVHIATPLIFLGAWFFGRLVRRVPWRAVYEQGGLLLAVAVPITIIALTRWLSLRPTLGGAALTEQQATLDWLALLIVLALCVGVAVWAATRLGGGNTVKTLLLTLLAGMLVFTVHTALLVCFTLADVPKDPLIYVQSTPDVTNVQSKIDNLSLRLTSGKDMVVYYDDETSWPYSWYLRDYGKASYQPKGPITPPDVPVVLVGLVNDDKVRPLMGNFSRTHLKMRSWFPEDEYKNLSLDAMVKTVTDPTMRDRFWRFLMYRELYDSSGKEITAGGLGSTDFVVYVRKDLSDSFWGPGVIAATDTRAPEDPYAAKQRTVPALLSLGSRGAGDGQFLEPKGVAVDAAGNIYVADTLNHRIQKFDSSGRFLLKWGAKGEGDGQLNEPWGLAVDKAGNLYVADTWNYRIQKFDATGGLLAKWGSFGDTRGQAGGQPGVFYGPRAIAIDRDGNLLVTDTGNKRVQKFDAEGKFLSQFGTVGTDEGRFNEPVGLALDPAGNIYVADTWNRRIQKFDSAFKLLAQWPVAGWVGQSVLNKPYLAADADGVYAADPDQHRILRFTPTGGIVASFGHAGTDTTSFNVPVGLALDAAGNVYVADSLNNRVLKFAAVK